MFKPLLRTLPSLSGNFTLACPLNYITKIDKDRFVCNIRTANIIPLQNSISNPTNKAINLLDNKYEFDVSKYYQNLVPTTSFYESKRTKDINSLQLFNLVADNDYVSEDVCVNSRNTDYEFGVKRISKELFGYQFMFYAPMYINSVESLPDTFEIHIKYYNKTNKGEIYNTFDKVISINIGKQTNVNYLKNYLSRYLNKIDSKVLDINTYYKRGVYYGIDVKNGGLQSYKYDNIRKIYSNYLNIMEFDEILANGFKETNQVMRQVIPVSFLFNISDFLTENENRYMYGKRFNISGYYCTSEYKHKFYDFDFNYRDLFAKELIFDTNTGKIGYRKTNNILDVVGGYHEKYLKNIFYKNKVTPFISRWKMIYSTDLNPYFINSSYSFSTNETGNYGEFPNSSISNDVYGLLDKESNKNISEQDYVSLILPNNTENTSQYVDLISNLKTKIEHYYTSWYNITANKDITDEQFDIKENWSNIIDNYSYFKGILYNVSDVLDKYNNKQSISTIYDIDDINYFGVFLNVSPQYLDRQEFNNIKSARYYIDTNDRTNNTCLNVAFFNTNICKFEQRKTKIDKKTVKEKKLNYYNPLFNFSLNNFNYNIQTDGVFREDKEGNFVNFKDFENVNMYIRTSDISTIIKENNSNQLKLKEIYSSFVFENFYKLDVSSDSVIDFSSKMKSDVVRESGVKRDSFYYSKKNSSTKTQFVENSTLSKAGAPYTMFYKTSFISVYDLIYSYKKLYKTELEHHSFKDIYNMLNVDNVIGNNVYEYVPRYYSGDVLLTDYMSKKIRYQNKTKINSPVLSKSNFSDYLYIDSYNLSNYIKLHNKVIDDKKYRISEHILDVTPHKLAYIRLENLDMISEYCENLYRDNKRRNGLYSNGLFMVKKMISLNYLGTNLKYSAKKIDYKTFLKLYNAGLKDAKVERIIIDDEHNFVYQTFEGDKLDNPIECVVNFYYCKKIYLLTSELFKLFSLPLNDSINYDQLYVLVKENSNNTNDRYYIEDGFEECINNDNCYKYIINNNLYKNSNARLTLSSIMMSNKIDSSEKIIVSPNEKKVTCDISKLSELEKNILLWETKNKYGEDRITLNKHGLCFRTYHKTHRTFNVYKYKEYYSDLFINIDLLPESAKQNIINKTTNNDKHINIVRYSKHNSLDIDTSNINIKEINGSKYLYVVLDIALDNTSLSFNLDDKYVHERFNYVNNEQLSVTNINKIFSKYHNYLLCFIKENIFKKFLNDYNTSIVIPENLTYIDKYDSLKFDNNKTNHLYKYNLQRNEFKNKIISINRYFSSCEPYLKETTSIPSFYNKYLIKYDELIDSGDYQYKLTNIDDSFVVYIEDLNIYNANKIRLIDPINKIKIDSPVLYFEYKHFNDNLMYNLESEFTIEYPNIIDKKTLDDIVDSKNVKTKNEKSEWNYFNNSVEFSLFKEYIQRKYLYDDENSYDNINMYDIHFLFLFNKYKISYIVKKVYSDLINNKDMYKIVYTYTLK